MCVITLTKRDGTPFDVTSVQEEDIVEICVWLGYTHPLGVLHYTTSESIILFCSADEMQWATHRAVKAMELHKEVTVIRAAAPSATPVRAYMTVVGGNLPKPYLHHHRGNLICLQATQTRWGAQCHLQAELGQPHWPWIASALGGSLPRGCTPWAECTPQKPTNKALQKPNKGWRSWWGWPRGHLS